MSRAGPERRPGLRGRHDLVPDLEAAGPNQSTVDWGPGPGAAGSVSGLKVPHPDSSTFDSHSVHPSSVGHGGTGSAGVHPGATGSPSPAFESWCASRAHSPAPGSPWESRANHKSSDECAVTTLEVRELKGQRIILNSLPCERVLGHTRAEEFWDFKWRRSVVRRGLAKALRFFLSRLCRVDRAFVSQRSSYTVRATPGFPSKRRVPYDTLWRWVHGSSVGETGTRRSDFDSWSCRPIQTAPGKAPKGSPRGSNPRRQGCEPRVSNDLTSEGTRRA